MEDYPRLTEDTFPYGRESFTQEQIASVGRLLCEHYPGYDSTGRERAELYIYVEEQTRVPAAFTATIGFWLGLYIDHTYDSFLRSEKGDYTQADWLDWAYEMMEG
jgi:hypothetical protein